MNLRGPRQPLPDFCAPLVFGAFFAVSILVSWVMLLAPGHRIDVQDWGLAGLLAAWLAIIGGVVLCKARPVLQKLPGVWPWIAAWLLLITVTIATTAVIWHFDYVLGIQLIGSRRGRFLLGIGGAATLVSAAMFRYLWVLGEWRSRREALALAQLDALQTRIEPHFLFNSLNTVAALLRVAPDRAEQALVSLSEILRAALDESSESTLGEVLQRLDDYLAIEQLRLGERLQIARDLDDLPKERVVPRWLLQPLVENALRHGIAARVEGGVLEIRGRRGVKGLEISVRNPLPEIPASHGSGHGLTNVESLIRYHFGHQASLSITHDDGYWQATLRFPDAYPHRR